MRPKKDKHVLPTLSDDPEEVKLLTDISTFFWKEVRTVLTTTDHDNIRLYHFGTFYRRYWLLDKLIFKCERWLQNIKEKNMLINSDKVAAVISNLALFKQMKERDQAVKEKEQRDKLRKAEYYENLRNTKGCMK